MQLEQQRLSTSGQGKAEIVEIFLDLNVLSDTTNGMISPLYPETLKGKGTFPTFLEENFF